MLGVLFTLPSSSQIISDIGTTSAPVFNEFYPLLVFVLGILIPIAVVVLVLKVFHPFGGGH